MPKARAAVDRALQMDDSVAEAHTSSVRFTSLTGNGLKRAALRMALSQRRPARSLILHPDRGSQFASAAYRQLLAQHGLIASMSRPSNCYDNAFIESFWSTLKYELVYHHAFATAPKLAPPSSITSNPSTTATRLHSSLDYLSPINFESKLN
jgi:putative transposase